MKKDFAKFLPRIIPSLFKLIENVFNDNKSNLEKGEDDDEKKVNI